MPDPTDKYALPDYVTSRVRYYNGQFLRDDDFLDEQRYQVSQHRRHERLLHVAGVVEGLGVSTTSGGVTIAKGSAVDRAGRPIVLAEDQALPVSGVGTYFVEIAYSEHETRPSDQNSSVQSNTRFTQDPKVASVVTTRTNPDAVLLAAVAVGTGGAVTVVDQRVYSGVKLPGLGEPGALRARSGAPSGWAELGCSLSVKGDAAVGGGLAVTGNLRVGGSGAASQKVIVDDGGGIGFAGKNLNPNDKKLWSPADGLLRWETHTSAGAHGFEIGHQSDLAAVRLDISGSSWLNGGDVGVGTTTPQAKLDVATTKANDGLRVSGKANWVGLLANMGAGSYNPISVETDRGIVYGGPTIDDPGGLVIVPWRSGASGLRLDAAGNVGIGLRTPGQRLSVAGTVESTTGGFKFPDGTVQATTAYSPPIGTVVAFAGPAAPTGYLLCDGAAVSRSTYKDLFAVLGTTWGIGNGSTTFNLPDLRGRFLRGVDGGAGRDPGRGLGSAQDCATGAPRSGQFAVTAGSHQHQLPTYNGVSGGGHEIGNGNWGQDWVPAEWTQNDGSHSHTVSGWDAESRPINVAVQFIICYR
jgi:hypothetical protein